LGGTFAWGLFRIGENELVKGGVRNESVFESARCFRDGKQLLHQPGSLRCAQGGDIEHTGG
jgi:hypothetical protein